MTSHDFWKSHTAISWNASYKNRKPSRYIPTNTNHNNNNKHWKGNKDDFVSVDRKSVVCFCRILASQMP